MFWGGGSTAVKSATEMALWLLRHRSFALFHQERTKISWGQKDYGDVSLGLPSLTETKLDQTLSCLTQTIQYLLENITSTGPPAYNGVCGRFAIDVWLGVDGQDSSSVDLLQLVLQKVGFSSKRVIIPRHACNLPWGERMAHNGCNTPLITICVLKELGSALIASNTQLQERILRFGSRVRICSTVKITAKVNQYWPCHTVAPFLLWWAFSLAAGPPSTSVPASAFGKLPILL